MAKVGKVKHEVHAVQGWMEVKHFAHVRLRLEGEQICHDKGEKIYDNYIYALWGMGIEELKNKFGAALG